MNTPDELLVLLERIGRLMQNEGYSDDLKPTQWEALRYFNRANRFSRSPSALTAYLGMTKGTVSQTVNALERKGLIDKKGVDGDRRQVRIELTARAHRLLERDPLSNVELSLARLPVREQGTLKNSLARLLRETLRNRGGRPFGACRTCRHFQKDCAEGNPHRCGLLDEPLSSEDSRKICVEQEYAA